VGEGTFGVVYQAFKKGAPTPQKVAVKQIKATKEGEGISLTACREITLLRELQHENIIGLEAVYLNAEDKSLYLVLEYAEYVFSFFFFFFF
jgi:cyclin-dependent kinase 8/11